MTSVAVVRHHRELADRRHLYLAALRAIVKPVAEIQHPEVQRIARKAQDFAASFRWCTQLKGCSLAFAVAGVVGIFRVDIVPAAGADSSIWVIVGDLPSAYIALDETDTWQDALRGYVAEMQAWVDAARAGRSVDELIPVNVPPTPANADLLASRLGLLADRLLSTNVGDLESDT